MENEAEAKYERITELHDDGICGSAQESPPARKAESFSLLGVEFEKSSLQKALVPAHPIRNK